MHVLSSGCCWAQVLLSCTVGSKGGKVRVELAATHGMYPLMVAVALGQPRSAPAWPLVLMAILPWAGYAVGYSSVCLCQVAPVEELHVSPCRSVGTHAVCKVVGPLLAVDVTAPDGACKK
jgi:hypothetical protein